MIHFPKRNNTIVFKDHFCEFTFLTRQRIINCSILKITSEFGLIGNRITAWDGPEGDLKIYEVFICKFIVIVLLT